MRGRRATAVVLGGRLRDRIEGDGQPLRASVAGVEAVATQARSSGELVSWSPASRPLQRRQAKVADLGRDVQVERGKQPRQFLAACIETAAKEASRRCDSQPLASRLLRRRRAAAVVLGGRRRDGPTAAKSRLLRGMRAAAAVLGRLRRDCCDGGRLQPRRWNPGGSRSWRRLGDGGVR